VKYLRAFAPLKISDTKQFFFQLFEKGPRQGHDSSGHLSTLDSLNLLSMLLQHVVCKLFLVVKIVESPEDIWLTDPAENVEVLQALARMTLLQVH